LITPNGEYIMSLSPTRQNFVDLATAKYGEGAVLIRSDIQEIYDTNSIGWPRWFFSTKYRVGRGEYKLPTETEIKTGAVSVPLEVLAAEAAKAKTSNGTLTAPVLISVSVGSLYSPRPTLYLVEKNHLGQPIELVSYIS
jgi:hypothetical protein